MQSACNHGQPVSFNYRATSSPATDPCFQSNLHLTLIGKISETNCSSVTFFAFKWQQQCTYIYRSELLLLLLLPWLVQVCTNMAPDLWIAGHMESYSNTSSTVGLVLWSLRVVSRLQKEPSRWLWCRENAKNNTSEEPGEPVSMSKAAADLIIDGRPAGSLPHRSVKGTTHSWCQAIDSPSQVVHNPTLATHEIGNRLQSSLA